MTVTFIRLLVELHFANEKPRYRFHITLLNRSAEHSYLSIVCYNKNCSARSFLPHTSQKLFINLILPPKNKPSINTQYSFNFSLVPVKQLLSLLFHSVTTYKNSCYQIPRLLLSYQSSSLSVCLF